MAGEENDDTESTVLISGQRLALNSGWNLVGGVAPMLAGLLAIPVLLDKMGTPRFGVLTLAWLVVGYFSLFDIGLGRALTKLVAEKLGSGEKADIPAIVWTSMALMISLGILGSLLFVALAPWLVVQVLKVPADLQSETVSSFRILGATIPIVITSTGLRGVLEAHQRFDLINAIRIPMGMLAFLGPLAVMPFSNSLVPVVATLGGVRLMSGTASLAFCLHVAPELRKASWLGRRDVRILLSYGGWMTVSNIVSPMMVSLDRFLIGATISVAAVAYYATPYEMITKLWIIPGALMGVLFPALSTALVSDRARASHLFRRASAYVFASLFPVVLATVTLAEPGLDFWLGAEFARNSTEILQLLAVGVLINSLAWVSFGLIQADGRPDLTAKLHLAELPVYLLILWFLLDTIGTVGAAVAWTLRVTVDAVVLYRMARPTLSDTPGRVYRIVPIVGVLLAALATGALLSDLPAKILFLAVSESLFVLTAWRWLLLPSDRAMARAALGRPKRA